MTACIKIKSPMTAKSIRDFLIEPLDEAESSDTYRRLVKVEDAGKVGQFFEIYNKHPQWIIDKGLQK
jgi:hypothetical protein